MKPMRYTESVSIQLSNEQDTQDFANILAKLELSGSVWLSGDLGAGKTTLTRYWLRALGLEGAVKSPTYTLVEPYRITQIDGNTKAVYHADLYRLQDFEELEFIGFDEYLTDNNALVIIEWASRAVDYLPEPLLEIEISKLNNDKRSLTLRFDYQKTQHLNMSELSNLITTPISSQKSL